MKIASKVAFGVVTCWSSLAWAAEPELVSSTEEIIPSETIVNSTETLVGPYIKTETVIQVGSNPLNQFVMHRLRKHSNHHRASILLLPPLGPDYDFWEFDEDGDFDRSIAAYLAQRNFDVFGYETRFARMSAGQCESGEVDCTVMQGWGLATIVHDVGVIRQMIESIHPGDLPVIGGHSAGAVATQAVLNSAPQDYLAALFWEGSGYSARPDVMALNQQWCQILEGMLAQGIYLDTSGQLLAALAQLTIVAPDSPLPFPLPGFPPGITNREAFVAILTMPPFLAPLPGAVLAAGDPISATLDFSSDFRLASVVSMFVPYAPIALSRDVNCSLAGDRTFTGNLEEFSGPIMVLSSGRGFDGTTLEAAQATSSVEITVNDVPEFGHSDAGGSLDHVNHVEKPIHNWLSTTVGGF
jgi:pimeloyl-ACP methyl ester carboxylesterase